MSVTLTGGGSGCTCQPYILPTATESVKGGIKVGHSLKMLGENNEVMNVAFDTVSSTVEGFMWINDVGYSSSVSSGWNIAKDEDIAAMLRSVFSVSGGI